MAPRKVPQLNTIFLKHWLETVKSRGTFFFPCFAAFSAFLVAKSDYLLGSNYILIAICLVTFFLGMAYAAFLSETLWLLDSMRLVFLLKENGDEGLDFLAVEQETTEHVTKVLAKRLRIEYTLFRWMMWMFYIAAVSIVWDLFFAKPMLAFLAKFIARMAS